jgi:hypothetical protein
MLINVFNILLIEIFKKIISAALVSKRAMNSKLVLESCLITAKITKFVKTQDVTLANRITSIQMVVDQWYYMYLNLN